MKRIANTELLRLADLLQSVMPRWVILPQASRLSSTSWDGDAHSTETATLIDMSAVFGTPANIDALLLRVVVRDSASSGLVSSLRMRLDNAAPDATSQVFRTHPVDDAQVDAMATIPTDANGDIYYDIVASGTNTFDAWIIVHGYHLK